MGIQVIVPSSYEHSGYNPLHYTKSASVGLFAPVAWSEHVENGWSRVTALNRPLEVQPMWTLPDIRPENPLGGFPLRWRYFGDILNG